MKKFKFSIEDNKFEVAVEEIDKNVVEVIVNGSHYTVKVKRENAGATPTIVPPIRKSGGKVAPLTPAPAATSTATKVVKSQLPGSVMRVIAAEGQAVKRGDVVLTIESMKMENSIMADCEGVVSKIFVQPGQSVMQEDKLFEMTITTAATKAEPEAAPAPAPKPAPAPAPKPATPAEPKAEPKASGNAKPLRSPLPGSIVKIVVSEGQAVKRGDTLLTMESMKMENEIKADRDAVVRSIKVTPGQSVMQDDVLLEME